MSRVISVKWLFTAVILVLLVAVSYGAGAVGLKRKSFEMLRGGFFFCCISIRKIGFLFPCSPVPLLPCVCWLMVWPCGGSVCWLVGSGAVAVLLLLLVLLLLII